MTPERRQEIERLYHEALARPADARPAFLAETCPNPELRREVELLLARSAGTFDAGGALAVAPKDLRGAHSSHLIGRRFGAYEIRSLLGAGGMGEVYRAHDLRLGRDVALKTLPAEFAADPERLTRFRREARTLAALNHPNIAAIYGIDEFEGYSFLVLELVEGDTLVERLARSGRIPLEEALTIAGSVADALEAAHAKGITHRDVKPANIKITPEGRVKVLDFGLAKTVRPAGHSLELSVLSTRSAATEAGRVLGTPAYMSPEQARGQDVDRRADVWAWGCVLFEALSGRRAFPGQTLPDVFAALMTEEPQWSVLPDATPERIRGLLRHCLEKSSERRPGSMTEVRAELELVRAGRRGVSRRTVAATLGGLTVAAVGLPMAFNVGGLRDRLVSGVGDPAIGAIAVLPLRNGSGDPAQEYFADGMTESLITSLSKLGALRVISRTSAMRYKDTTLPLAQIARELDVDAFVEGSVTRSGTRVRIVASLVDPATRQQLWTDEYERELADVLILQSGIARAIARRIQLQLTPEADTLLSRASQVDPEGYDIYLQGMAHLNTFTEEGQAAAEQMFQRALQRNPDLALAYAGLARVWGERMQLGYVSPRQAAPLALANTEKAMALDASLDEVHYTLAALRTFGEWRWAEGELEYLRTIQLNPGHSQARAGYAHVLMLHRRVSEGLEYADESVRLDPRNPRVLAFRGVVHTLARRYDDALADLHAALALDPANELARNAMWQPLHMLRRYDEALEAFRAAQQDDKELLTALDRGFREAGYEGALTAGAEMLETRSATRFARPVTIARLYAATGQFERALQWLERAVASRDPGVPYDNVNPFWDSVRGNPQLRAIFTEMGLPAG